MNSSSAKVLQIPRTIRGSNSKNVAKRRSNGCFQLQNAANSKGNRQDRRSNKRSQNGRNIFPKQFQTLLEYDVSIQHRPQFEPAWTHLTPTWAKVGSNTALFGQTLDDRVQCRVFLGMVLRTCRTPRTHCTTVPLTVPSGRATLSYLDF